MATSYCILKSTIWAGSVLINDIDQDLAIVTLAQNGLKEDLAAAIPKSLLTTGSIELMPGNGRGCVTHAHQASNL